MQEIDRAFTQWPFFGVRQMRDYLVLLGYGVGRKRVRRLMRLMGLEAIYQKPRTSTPNPENKKYPYLLRDLAITRPNQVWCTGYHLHPYAQRFFVSGGCNGLVQPQSLVLEAFKQHGY